MEIKQYGKKNIIQKVSKMFQRKRGFILVGFAGYGNKLNHLTGY